MISRVLALLALVGFAGGMVGCETAPAPTKTETKTDAKTDAAKPAEAPGGEAPKPAEEEKKG